MDELLQRVVMQSEKVIKFANSDLTRLELNIDRMKITISLPSDATLTLSDNRGTRVYFQVNEPNSLMLLEQIAKDASTKEKLKACHHYQQRVLDKEMSCLLTNVITETETEATKDVLLIDSAGRGWSLIADTEGGMIDLAPVCSEGAYRLTVSDIETNPSLAISFSVEHITYYREGTDLILGKKIIV